MFFRQFLNDETACASYLFGCKTAGELAVVDAHADLVEDYLEAAEAQGSRIAAVLETHVQADHISGLPRLVERTGATAYLPAGSGAEFEHRPLADGELVELGNTVIQSLATPGHAPAHHAYLVTDHRRGDEPWLVLTGDGLLVGDVGRPDLHAGGDQGADQLARTLYRSMTERLLALPDHLLVYPAHYAGSVCGRGLSGHPASTIGFERRHNEALAAGSEDEFVALVLEGLPPAPEHQAEIVAANRSGRSSPTLA
jgi:hydroxyacylglutathione hydrolase